MKGHIEVVITLSVPSNGEIKVPHNCNNALDQLTKMMTLFNAGIVLPALFFIRHFWVGSSYIFIFLLCKEEYGRGEKSLFMSSRHFWT